MIHDWIHSAIGIQTLRLMLNYHTVLTLYLKTLLRHHPQSAFSSADNVSESFASLLEDLHKQNLTDIHSNLNCSSLSQYPLLPKNLCNDGTLFKCMSASDMLELVPQSTKSVSEALARLCPLLLLQLHNSACSAPISDQSTSLKPSSLAGIVLKLLLSC
ncbi:zinc transporter ZIP14 [Trichonephila clavata]|uniref:Zinc transporter ZIP14 n=1 Tax=Trichonephila clavata TaxID=2740835 RepID=A0A8X6HHT2_TRICU|nr:zinc transporter ZIP14 [Trichonephila clavata]